MFTAKVPWSELWRSECSQLPPEALLAHLDGRAHPAAGAAVARHLRECPACENLAADYRAFLEAYEPPPEGAAK